MDAPPDSLYREIASDDACTLEETTDMNLLKGTLPSSLSWVLWRSRFTLAGSQQIVRLVAFSASINHSSVPGAVLLPPPPSPAWYVCCCSEQCRQQIQHCDRRRRLVEARGWRADAFIEAHVTTFALRPRWGNPVRRRGARRRRLQLGGQRWVPFGVDDIDNTVFVSSLE
jgi:hypothetical protein